MAPFTLPTTEQDQLTEAERALLNKLCEGLTFRQIDNALALEAGTAHRLRKHLFRKIGVRTRHEASAAVHPTNTIRQDDLKQVLTARYRLAKRECDVLILLYRYPELSRKQIGEHLGISDNTTRLTINRTNKKLGVKTRAEAMYAIYTALQIKKGTAMQTNTQEQAAITELTTRWGYRDISVLLAEEYPEDADTTAYLCALQTPEGGPVYCKTAERLFRELNMARTRNEPYMQCPAPDPSQHMWMVVGNFDSEDEGSTDQRGKA